VGDWRRSFTSPDGHCLAAAAFPPVGTAVEVQGGIAVAELASILAEGLGGPGELAVPLVVDAVEGLAAERDGIGAEADDSEAARGGTAAAAALVGVVAAGRGASPAG